jgi:hypothetical protein
MFTPMPTWARATGVLHKSAVVRAANASPTTLDIISPFRSKFQPCQLRTSIIPRIGTSKSARRNGSRTWHQFWADDGATGSDYPIGAGQVLRNVYQGLTAFVSEQFRRYPRSVQIQCGSTVSLRGAELLRTTHLYGPYFSLAPLALWVVILICFLFRKPQISYGTMQGVR